MISDSKKNGIVLEADKTGSPAEIPATEVVTYDVPLDVPTDDGQAEVPTDDIPLDVPTDDGQAEVSTVTGETQVDVASGTSNANSFARSGADEDLV